MTQNNKTVMEPAQEIRVACECDVCVVGGGPGGIGAAIAAARSGAKTVLLERYNFLGGMSTGGLVTMFPHMSGGGKELMPGGIMTEVIDRLDAVGGAFHPAYEELGSTDPKIVGRWKKEGLWFVSDEGRVRMTLYHDPEFLKCIFNEMVEDAGVKLFLHAWGTSALVENNRVYGVTFESKSGRQAILSKVVIDATGDGDLLPSAGAEFTSKMDFHLRIRNVAQCFHIAGIDADKFEAWYNEDPQAFKDIIEKAFNLHLFLLGGQDAERLVKKVRSSNSIWVNNFIPGMGGLNISTSNAEDLTLVSKYAHSRMMRSVDFYKKNVPGFENLYIRIAAPAMGLRGGRRLIGEYTVVEKDITAGADYPDTVIAVPHLEHDVMPEFPLRNLPYRCLVPKTVNGLLVAGRSFSSQDRVNEMLNLMPHCMGLGQAAGTAAAMAVSENIEVREVDYKKLRASLRSQGVYLPLHGDEKAQAESDAVTEENKTVISVSEEYKALRSTDSKADIGQKIPDVKEITGSKPAAVQKKGKKV